MRNVLIVVLMAFGIIACSKKEAAPPAAEKTLSVIPLPASYQFQDGELELTGPLRIVTSTGTEKIASFLKDFLNEKNIASSMDSTLTGGKSVTLKQVADNAQGPEGYTLVINDEGIVISGSSEAGIFYGIQTLIQLIGAHERKLPFVEIKDEPRFAYRGMHLDVGRHMYPVEFIKKYIDLLAHHKYNRFHWHLTEDQGWRIEIKKYPKLQEVGAYRKETVIGKASTSTRKDARNFDGKRYGGFYTQEEVKDVVQYAADRYVTIIPEIEMPGHALAALSAYPKLGCTGGPYEAATTWGVFDDVFCAGKEDAFVFLEDVLDEVIPLFPGKYIHIGGDECPKTQWEKCPHCKKRMGMEKLADAHALQSYFIQRIEKYVNSKGKQIIGWDEILEGGLAPNATVMSWRGEEGGIAAAQQNHDVIMTPGNWCYFDHYQAGPEGEPLAIGNMTTVEEVYSYEPVPAQLDSIQAKHILGAQANVWTEYIPTSDHVEYMVYPRACAMAEVLWSKPESRKYEDFKIRMKEHADRLSDWKVNFARHILKDEQKSATSTQ